MDFFFPDSLFYLSSLLYIAAAFAAIVFLKQQKLCTFLSQSICIIASIIGATASTIYILSGKDTIILQPFHSSIPFVSIHITIDPLSGFFVLILSILVCCVSLYSIGYLSHYYGKRNVSVFHVLYATFILSMMLVFTASNAIFFFMAWEAMAVISYFLVVFESEHKENLQGGLLYIVMTHIGTAFLIVAFMMMFKYTGTFDLSGTSELIPSNIKNMMFLCFLIGFGTKAGVIPLHIWLPYAHPAAPGNISALMSGVMIKTAIYGMLRFIFIYLGIEATWWGTIILVIGMVSAILGVLYAFIEPNIKKILAYSSIENMGIIFIGIGVSFIAFSKGFSYIGALALIAILLHCLNHALFKGSLFLGVGSIHYATHTKNLENLGGLIKVMPLTAVLFLGGALSISAIVPFNGFISEWLIYQSIFASILPDEAGLSITFILAVATLALAGALAAACFIKLFGISFLGLPRSKLASQAKEVPLVMNIGSGILVTLCLFGGLFPLIFLNFIDKVVVNMTGTTILGQLQGGFFFAYYPLEINGSGNRISPFILFLVLLALIVVALLILRILGGNYVERRYGTWDCGFNVLNSRMQYSATAFSKPIKIVFKIIFKSTKDLKIIGDPPYHPDSIEYTIKTESVFEKYIYIPLLIWTTSLSRRLKFMIQTGSVHTYLLYIFMAVLVLMLYNRIA